MAVYFFMVLSSVVFVKYSISLSNWDFNSVNY
jgi:hypothetical protein